MGQFGFLMDNSQGFPWWPGCLEQRMSVKQANEVPWYQEQPSEHCTDILRKLHTVTAAYCLRAMTKEGSPAVVCSCLLLPCAEMDASPGIQRLPRTKSQLQLAHLKFPSRHSRIAARMGVMHLGIYSELHAGKSVQEDDHDNQTVMVLGQELRQSFCFNVVLLSKENASLSTQREAHLHTVFYHHLAYLLSRKYFIIHYEAFYPTTHSCLLWGPFDSL